jgi:CobQ/CobB/MinD/ParA nucleotide binding domain
MEGERAMAANIGKGVSNGGSSAGATVHFSLQGKGGVGKSVVASWLAQYFRSKDLCVTCIDTDPVNATLTQFKDLNAEHLNVLKAGGINEKQFDALVEQVCSRKGIYIVDTGATTFVPLWHYMLEHQLFRFLVDQGRRVFVHLVVTGGQGMQDTLAGFKRVAETAPDKSIVVWLNEYFGEVERDGKRFEDLQLAQQFAAQLAGAVLIRERNRNTFGDDIKLMLQGFLTFDAAIRSEQFGLVSKQRLTIVRRDLFDQLDSLGLMS